MFNLDIHPVAISYAVVGIIASYFLAVVSYRLLLHPLSRYPGPFLAKLSDAYPGFYAFRRRLHLTTQRDHQKYGPVMRHGPNKLVFNSVQALRDIYQNEKVTKADAYLVSQAAPNVFNLFNAIDRDLHRIKRKLVGAAVSERAMRTFEPTLSNQVDVFVKQLLSPPDAPINMTERSKRLGLDIVGHLSFGYDLRLQTEETNRFLVNAIQLGNYRSNLNMQFPFIHKAHLHNAIGRFFYPSWDEFTRLLQTMIGTRLSQDKDAQPDFYSYVSDALAAESEEARQLDLWTEAMFFTIAGGDTTAAAIAAAFFYLSRNPECYRKLAQEVRTTFKSSSEVRGGPALSSCHYLRACVDESLRMSPPTPSTPWRQLAPDEKDDFLIIDGYPIPKGVSFGVNIYSLHHNEKYFPDPYRFSPERWLPPVPDTPESRAAQKIMRDAFSPFSVGARSCAGKPVAYLETSLTLAKTLWHLDFELAPGVLRQVGAGRKGGESGRERPEEFQLFDQFTSAHDGPYLMFKPRGDFVGQDETKGVIMRNLVFIF
ncbi:cytochrome P450 [Annulohypoxylon truncatum]|uniref:cytochrome P450 n=1 Tax=Annulohypoxylon truncatum TaxID=327061 RepID=UPI002008E592|nr:cytochrome P450 [Annulohypoxylon truncatum]KAI1208484.1 cytochrome P450 [Annulohypoxylon truncatum]